MKKAIPLLLKIKRTLGPLEYEVMKAVWNKDKTTVREILLSSFQKQKKLAYTTIMTVMDNLYKKGFVKREKIKKTYYYYSSFEEKNILHQSLLNISQSLFSQYGKKAVFFSFLIAAFPWKLNFPFLVIKQPVWSYRTPAIFGFATAFLFIFFIFSLLSLWESLNFLGTFTYFQFFVLEPEILFNRTGLFLSALWESLPIMDLVMAFMLLLGTFLLAKKLTELMEFKTPTLKMGGVVFAASLIAAFFSGLWLGRKNDYFLPFWGRKHPTYDFISPRFNSHGVIGIIDSLGKDTLVVKEKTGALKTILVDKSTQIRHGFVALNFSDLKKDMHIIVLGEPRKEEGAIRAKIIRVINGNKTKL